MNYSRIRALRKERGMTQQAAAECLGLNRRTYSAYETGTNAVGPELLGRLARLYGVSADYLLGLTDWREPYPGASQGTEDG